MFPKYYKYIMVTIYLYSNKKQQVENGFRQSS